MSTRGRCQDHLDWDRYTDELISLMDGGLAREHPLVEQANRRAKAVRLKMIHRNHSQGNHCPDEQE